MNYYFLGIGGIGMSAIARFFNQRGDTVYGYDATESQLTQQLISEGISVHYIDDPALIPNNIDLVIYTPAIPEETAEFQYFLQKGIKMVKRSQMLGELTRDKKCIAVSGSHGKTSTSSLIAHILSHTPMGCSAFLGGVAKNFNSNIVVNTKSEYVVVEADEFDRSFHWLSPYMAVVTATDPDHLDIYGTPEAYWASFEKFVSLIRPGGVLIIHEGLQIHPVVPEGVTVYTYNRESGDFHAENIRVGNGEIVIDFVSPTGVVKDIHLGVPIRINVENGVAAMALAQLNGVTDDELRSGMASFRGVERRFDFKIKNDRHVFLSDYAHHPAEIRESALSIRELYKDRHITALFQPHLYTRTRDFYRDFAQSLSLLNEVILVDIYPAREQPIPGVTTKLIYDLLAPGVKKMMISKDEIMSVMASKKDELDVLISLGAGDIEDFVPRITKLLEN